MSGEILCLLCGYVSTSIREADRHEDTEHPEAVPW